MLNVSPMTAAWGLDAIEDPIVSVALFAGWLREAERRVAFTQGEQLRKERR